MNDPERLKRLKGRLELARSIEDALGSQEKLQVGKKEKLSREYANILPVAEKKLKFKNADVLKLTKLEITSVLCATHKKEVNHFRHENLSCSNNIYHFDR